MSLSLSKAIEMFVRHKKIERRSPKTIKTYYDDLIRFQNYLNENNIETSDIKNLDKNIVLHYFEYLTFKKKKWTGHPTNISNECGLKAKTINNVRRNLGVFFNYLLAEECIEKFPLVNIKPQPEDIEEFEVFTTDQLMALLSEPNKHTFSGFRDYTIMLIMSDNGIRTNELFNVRVKDVDLQNKHIIVQSGIAKGNKKRYLPISDIAANCIKELIHYCRLNEEDYLILNQFGGKYSSNTFAKNVKKYGELSGIKNVRVSPHTIRHTFATQYLLNGGDTISLQLILGHNSQDMTARYVHYNKMILASILNRNSLLNGIDLIKVGKSKIKKIDNFSERSRMAILNRIV
ncbi:tyrosine-type recombinase/integrase [Paenibacillus sp. FSL H3-0286]|uniref:tyrosine-type recombinase/integrase n=1 Tax=Paenibacillus sp. FSL H3-0286 TaxID=2921427 RepID=UPI00324ABFB2